MRVLAPNERLMLHHVRRLGSIAKADLARVTGLSTQTASVIINRLLQEQLVRKLDVVRGKIGQPSQPIALNPAGAYAIGVHIGRRSLEVMLLDLAGQPQFRAQVAYSYPEVGVCRHRNANRRHRRPTGRARRSAHLRYRGSRAAGAGHLAPPARATAGARCAME